MNSFRNKLSPIQFIAIGYFITILAGTLLLILPFSAKDGRMTPFLDALFIATSATCVTGLSVFDTFAHWTFFGQLIILILIQIGGLGFMTVISLIFIIFKKNVGVYERTIMIQSAGTFSFHGIFTLIKRILIGTFFFELVGALLLSIQFIQDYGFWQGVWFSIFHSISAFCNAGFDLTGNSLANYANNPLVILTVTSLVIIGGLGFLVWSELYDNRKKFHFNNLSLHTKMVLIYNAAFFIIGFLFFFAFEYNNSLKDLSFGQKVLDAWFMSVTPRTAGFSIFDAGTYSQSGIMLTILLMFIGGNPGSTAGGVKTTTIIVVLTNIIASAKQKEEVTLFKKKISNNIIKQSSALVITYLCCSIFATILICIFEPYSATEIIYEVVSAAGTVGLSYGITSTFKWCTKIILIILMFAGRCGALTLFSAFIHKGRRDKATLKCPEGNILVG